MKSISILVLAVALFSCQQTKDKTNLEDYVLKPSELEQAKVLIYETNMNGNKDKKYCIHKKNSETEKTMTSYNSRFKKTDFTKISFNEQGLTTTELIVFNPNGTSETAKMADGFAYSYDIEKTTHFNFSANLLNGGTISTEVENKISLDTVEIDGKQQQIVLINGNGSITMNDTIKMDRTLEQWYAYGIGMVKKIVIGENFSNEETYIKTISLKEFEALKETELADLRNYIFKPANYTKPEVGVFQQVENGDTTTYYQYFEAIDDSKLSMTEYNNQFEKELDMEFIFKDDGVHATKMQAYFNGEVKPESKITEALVFPYTINDTINIQGKMYPAMPINVEVDFSVKENSVSYSFEEKEINGITNNVVVIKYTVNPKVTNLDNNETFNVENTVEHWYVFGNDIAKTITKGTDFIKEKTFIKYISVEEFKKLQEEK